jgi:signal transduction histidine kinase
MIEKKRASEKQLLRADEKEQNPIIEVTLENELDVVLSYKKARQLAEIAGLSFAGQTKFSTAVSEVCRNALVHARKGMVRFYVTNDGTGYFVEALVSDQGPGIKDLEALYDKFSTDYKGRKTGLMNCRILSEVFEIHNPKEGGTTVRVGKRLPDNHPPINRLILSGWRKHFKDSSSFSPYDEIKKQNKHLLQALDDLKEQKEQTQNQLEKIKVLNDELECNYKKIKSLSEEVEKQNRLLKKRNEELDDFSYVVSHDLKAPVANLQSLLNMLEEGVEIEQEEIKQLLGGQVHKIDLLIKSILNYSRTGHEKVEKKEVDLNLLIAGIVSDLGKPENFEIEIQDNFPIIITEEIFIVQVFDNLLTNSVKYNDKPAGQVKIGYSEVEENRLYYVEDNGPGIPSGKRDYVFKMFTVLQKIKGVDSTGVGLAIIKKIINARGGEICVQDAEFFDTGSRFCFTWPAEEVMNI